MPPWRLGASQAPKAWSWVALLLPDMPPTPVGKASCQLGQLCPTWSSSWQVHFPEKLPKQANQPLPRSTGAPHPLVTTKPAPRLRWFTVILRAAPVRPCMACGALLPQLWVCVAGEPLPSPLSRVEHPVSHAIQTGTPPSPMSGWKGITTVKSPHFWIILVPESLSLTFLILTLVDFNVHICDPCSALVFRSFHSCSL